MNAIVWPDDEAQAHEIGNKAYALVRARRAGLAVPAFVIVSSSACNPEFRINCELRAALQRTLAVLCPSGELVAVRSSGIEEDGTRFSFAGQLESFLLVPPEQVAQRIADVWRSARSARILNYRARHGVTTALPAPAVIVQRMVDAEAAGVAFSADPVSGRRAVAVVGASRGLAAEVVLGKCDADTWHIERSGRIDQRALAGPQACLGDAQAQEVAALARRCERLFGAPQDIEWAMEGGRLWLLQSRQITSLAAIPDPDGEPALWDSSNIAESYGGVTTPLTFSFIRRCYEHVYRNFSRIAGVDAVTIAANDDEFRCMLGLMRGRVYYNLLSWYRLLALMPGFAHNRRFLDQMLGVREEAAFALLDRLEQAARRSSPFPRLAWIRQLARFGWHYVTLRHRIRRFHRLLDVALARTTPDIQDMRADELAAYFRALENSLLAQWVTPQLNAFFAMIVHGLLLRLVERWIGPGERGLANDLLTGDLNIVSLEPVLRIREMARVAARHPDFAALLYSGTAESIFSRLPRVHNFASLFADYLDRFGDRCMEELELESAALVEEPLPLLRAVGRIAMDPGATKAGNGHLAVRQTAERRVRQLFARRPLRHLVFRCVLQNARARIRDRENLRFARTRVFGRVRAVLVEMGKRLCALGLLDSHRDVFYLELEELLGFVHGNATCTDLRGLASLRKAEFKHYRSAERPPDRFETRGIAQHAARSVGTRPAQDTTMGEQRRGIGCSAGIVRGRARVIGAPEGIVLRPHEIVVAERTDPGWVMLLSAASGLIVERGSLLSHAAIVAREMGIPSVINLRHACSWLTSGDLVELDGATGVVRRLEQVRVTSTT